MTLRARREQPGVALELVRGRRALAAARRSGRPCRGFAFGPGLSDRRSIVMRRQRTAPMTLFLDICHGLGLALADGRAPVPARPARRARWRRGDARHRLRRHGVRVPRVAGSCSLPLAVVLVARSSPSAAARRRRAGPSRPRWPGSASALGALLFAGALADHGYASGGRAGRRRRRRGCSGRRGRARLCSRARARRARRRGAAAALPFYAEGAGAARRRRCRPRSRRWRSSRSRFLVWLLRQRPPPRAAQKYAGLRILR